MSDTRGKIIETINDVCKPHVPNLSDGDKPLLSEGINSLDFASILIALEDEFGLSLENVRVENLNTLNRLVAYVDANRKP